MGSAAQSGSPAPRECARAGSLRSRWTPRRSERGIALLIVLWLSVLLTVLASGLAYDTRAEVYAARNTVAVAVARQVADGAVQRTLLEMVKPPSTPLAWHANGEEHRWQEGEASVSVVVTDESGRIDLNNGAELLLRNVFIRLGGATEEQAVGLVAAIQDWRDADDLPRPNGAEDAQYRAAGRKYGPANQPFESVEELRRVLGVSDAIFSGVANALTVYSRTPGINPNVASRDALLALPNATPEQVDSFIEQRRVAIETRQPIPPFPPAAGLAAGDVRVWRVRATAALPEGVQFVREAVVRTNPGDPRSPATVFLWKEGT